MSKLTSEEIKRKIEELREQESEISHEIYKLEQMNKGYWIAKVDLNYDCCDIDYCRLGFTTEAEANEKIDNMYGKDSVWYELKEVSEEYNSKMYKAERLQSAYNILNNSDFKKYAELITELEKDLHELMEELDIPTYAKIM